MPRLPFTFSMYIGRQFLVWFIVTLAACCFVALLVDFGETLRITSQNNEIGFRDVLGLTFLKFPNLVQEILPFAFLFSATAFLARLGRTRELVVARATGISAWQFLTPLLLIAAAVGLLTIILWQPFAAFMTGEGKTLEKTLIHGETSQFAVADNGLWLREEIALGKNTKGYAILHAPQILSSDPLILQNATRLTFDQNDGLIERLDAKTAHLVSRHWKFNDVWITDADDTATQKDRDSRPTSFERQQIQENFVPPRAISFWKFPFFIEIAEAAGFEVETYRVYFHSLLSRPILFCAMILIAAMFSLYYARTGGSWLVLSAGIAGLGLYFFTIFMHTFGNTGLLPAFVAAWTPSIIASLIGLTMLLHLEDG